MNAPRAILWDVDGTLVDTAERHFLAWVRLAEKLSRPFTRADFAATFGLRNPDIIRMLFEKNASDARCDELGFQKEEYYRELVRNSGIEFLPGVPRLLREFAAQGWLQAIGSSAPRQNLDLIIEATNSANYFTAVIASEDVTRGKPDPEVYLLAAQRLAVPTTRCVVFEDAVVGVESARAAGMPCVAVRFVGHHPEDKLRAAGASMVVESLEAVKPQEVSDLLNWSE